MSFLDKIGLDKKQVFFLLLIFLIGFGFRAHLLKYQLFFEFDSYWHARMAEQVIKTGLPFGFNSLFSIDPHGIDPMSYYQLGGGPMSYTGIGWWYLTAGIYKIFSLPLTGGVYNKALWIEFVKFLPALFGALAGIAMFFYFRTMYGLRAGYLAGFFTAVSSGFIYRSMAGFFEGSSVVFLFMVIGFFFLAKAIKKLEFNRQSMIDAGLAGLFLGATAWIGGWYLIVGYTVLPFGFFSALIIWFRNQNAINFLKIFGIALVVFAVINFPQPAHPGLEWFNATISYVKPYFGMDNSAVVNPATSEGDIGAVFRSSVGEQTSGFLSFGNKFNALIVFPIIALFLIPYRVWKNKNDYTSLLLWFWIGITFAMAFLRLQMTFAFGLALAAASAFCFNEIIELAKKRTAFERKVFGVGLALFVLISVASAALFTNMQVPNIESEAGWKDALAWLKTNTPTDAKMFNWWDEGHWISFIGERNVLLDNRNIDLNGDSDVALAIVTDDVNVACGIIKKYGSDYAVFGRDLLEKEYSLAYYGYKSLDSRNPKLQGFAQAATLSCNKDASGNGFVCNGKAVSETQMAALPTVWTNKPSEIQNNVPIFIYRSKDNSLIHIIFGARVNNSFLARAWMNDPSVYCLENVFDNSVKIFKVKK
jgi:asparagine N-glycosylation enzyme membrane subunit Stt3